jgi:hypothetical protein
MFDYWRKKRRLLKQIAAHDEKYSDFEVRDKNDDDYQRTSVLAGIERRYYEDQLGYLETQRLHDKAERLGISVLEEMPRDDISLWVHTHNYLYLTDEGKVRLIRLISERRFELAKKWTDLLAPILSTIISLLALAISIIALYRT